MQATITVTPSQLEGTLVAWVSDDTDECTGIEWFPEGAVIPDYRNGKEISCKLTGRCISAWLALHAGGIFSGGRRDLTFHYDDSRRKLTVS